jgi:hypothetical protein
MKRALPKFPAEAIESQRLVKMLLDEAADRLHSVGLAIAVERLGPAAQTSSITCLLRLFGREKKLNIFPARTARRTRGPAIHSRTRDGENKLSVSIGLASYHRFPA